ncbi:short-chain dehydrogenase [Rhodoplanes elegans]|uniref:Short-chain dehydrogenase n=1 Tax=Rhodoplanes elegans TaxID=29408 RepID=A0A327KNF7_9BRAD|nr:SDR family oxidoreductase [Rhodoplanes elegans]MBK5957488.1 short-chain dehydrogenase [Rhodoplanes elegans]RAI38842.1 short-chain dehydrogenase [Rhodoplanes elegans]
MDLGLVGKVAIVTGASRGIGRAIALRLAAEGMDIALVARSANALHAVRRDIDALGRECVAWAADLREPNVATEIVAKTSGALGRLDLLVNSAGATRRGDFLTLTDDDWTDGFALKFFGTMRLTRAAWPLLQAAGGSVITIAGTGGRTGDAEFAIGGSVNAALGLLTKVLADRGIADGVRVNTINPGIIETERFFARLGRVMEETGVSEAEAREKMLAAHRVARFGRPEEVADLVAVMASPRFGHLAGAIVDLDGGETRTV